MRRFTRLLLLTGTVSCAALLAATLAGCPVQVPGYGMLTGIDPELVDEVVLGAANQAGEDNRNIARMALLLAGLPVGIPGVTFSRLPSGSKTMVCVPRGRLAFPINLPPAADGRVSPGCRLQQALA